MPIPGELINGDSIYDFDVTKLSVNTLDIGLAGIEVYDLLRDEYDIQIEFGDLGNMLAYLSIGDRQREVERLVSALSEIRRRFGRRKGWPHEAGIHRPESGCLTTGCVLCGKGISSADGDSQAGSAVSLSCAIRPESRSWLPERRSRRTF